MINMICGEICEVWFWGQDFSVECDFQGKSFCDNSDKIGRIHATTFTWSANFQRWLWGQNVSDNLNYKGKLLTIKWFVWQVFTESLTKKAKFHCEVWFYGQAIALIIWQNLFEKFDFEG